MMKIGDLVTNHFRCKLVGLVVEVLLDKLDQASWFRVLWSDGGETWENNDTAWVV